VEDQIERVCNTLQDVGIAAVLHVDTIVGNQVEDRRSVGGIPPPLEVLRDFDGACWAAEADGSGSLTAPAPRLPMPNKNECFEGKKLRVLPHLPSLL
jgi:hypothetical protein